MESGVFTRLRLAFAVATAVMTQLGADDPLTRVYVQTAESTLPLGWTIPGWSEGRMYWLDTVRNCTTWIIPDPPAGVGQFTRSSPTTPTQMVSSWGPAPPPAP